MYHIVARYILAPGLDFLRRTKTTKCLRELERSQWWPPDKILDLQNQRLRQLVRYAYKKVPYYQRIFDERTIRPNDIETSEDLAKLPVLTKQLIRANFNDLIARDFPKTNGVQISTGGSTGEPFRFYTTKHDHVDWSYAASQRAHSWAGFTLGDKRAVLVIKYPTQTVAEGLWQTCIRFLRRTLFLNVLEMSVEKMPLFVRKLEDFQPKYITGFPSAIYQLAQFIQREGKTKIKPKAIMTGGEQLYDYQKDAFRAIFGCDTYSYYRSNESHYMAFECPQHSGYHITAEGVVIEIVDDSGKPVATGEQGRILITNLNNYAMPFIRYDINDIGALSDKACPCGRGLPLLAALGGRTADVILTKSKGPVPGINLPWNFLACLGVEQFQIVQETYEKVVLKFVLSDGLTQQQINDLKKEVMAQYRPILGEDMDIAIEFANEIPPTATGKRRVVVSNLPPEKVNFPSE